jgi:hypothetical protein
MTAKRAAIRAIYAQVGDPHWAAANLDALADVLRDLSWLPPGPVTVRWRPAAELSASDRSAIESVLRHAAAETAAGPRPVRLA